jgi:hypothetical protein
MSDEPFILATQATQVYYVEDPIDADWSTVVIPSYYDINEAENIEPGNALRATPQDVGTPGTRGKVSTRVLVEMVARREAEHRMNALEEEMQQIKQQMNKMQEMMSASQGGHNLEAPSSQHGSNSRQVRNCFAHT